MTFGSAHRKLLRLSAIGSRLLSSLQNHRGGTQRPTSPITSKLVALHAIGSRSSSSKASLPPTAGQKLAAELCKPLHAAHAKSDSDKNQNLRNHWRLDSSESQQNVRRPTQNEFITVRNSMRARWRKLDQPATRESVRKILDLIQSNGLGEDLPPKPFASVKHDLQALADSDLLYLVREIGEKYEHEYRSVLAMIDEILCSRIREKSKFSNLDYWCFATDVLFARLQQDCSLLRATIESISKQRSQLQGQQLIQLVYLILLHRDSADILNEIEDRLPSMIADANAEDLVIICLAYFKTRFQQRYAQIRSKAVYRAIIQRTIKLLGEIDEKSLTFASIVKCLRYSAHSSMDKEIMALARAIKQHPQFTANSIPNNIQFVKLLEALRIYDEDTLEKLVQSVLNDPTSMRIKDIQYSLSSISNFAYNNCELNDYLKDGFDRLCDQFFEMKHGDRKHRLLYTLAAARSLALFGYYNIDFIKLLSKLIHTDGHQERKLGRFEFERSALLIYVATRLEARCDVMADNLEFLRDLSRSMGRFGSILGEEASLPLSLASRLDSSGHIYSSAYKRIATRLAAQVDLKRYHFNFQVTMPHQNYADLVVSNDPSVPGRFDALTLMPKEVPNGQRHCIILSHKRADYSDASVSVNGGRLNGQRRFIRRLLTRLGYSVILIDIERPDIQGVSAKLKLALGYAR